MNGNERELQARMDDHLLRMADVNNNPETASLTTGVLHGEVSRCRG